MVLLQHTDTVYRPIALALKGNSNRSGSIDGVENNANTELVLKYFLGKLASGAYDIHEPYYRLPNGRSITTIEHVLTPFERNMNDGHENTLDGRPVVFALICRAVWDACASSTAAKPAPATSFYSELFGDSSVPAEMYCGSLTKVLRHLRELSVVSKMLSRRKCPWKPTASDGAQHSGEEMRHYLQEARRAFKGSAVVLKGLRAYELEVEDCFTD
ncbi:hypothetical protein FRUB_09353 [Fimbriiglobus ruber]|uniref:Uncharacterized protein n=1 Tax=Fimbriiglobus ruber TaxID=1908690 RepID=A0A225D5D6_9BACT|nr:hypothetical protein FRUB_09353 [Fimbriiglobus ruber]